MLGSSPHPHREIAIFREGEGRLRSPPGPRGLIEIVEEEVALRMGVVTVPGFRLRRKMDGFGLLGDGPVLGLAEGAFPPRGIAKNMGDLVPVEIEFHSRHHGGRH